MNDDNPGRRGATKIDGELPTCAQKARRKPQTRLWAASRAGSGRQTLASCGRPTHDRRSGAGKRGIPAYMQVIRRGKKMVPTRLGCSVNFNAPEHIRKGVYNSLIWFDKIVFPSFEINTVHYDYGIVDPGLPLIRAGLFITEFDLFEKRSQKDWDRFDGVRSPIRSADLGLADAIFPDYRNDEYARVFRLKDFAHFLQRSGLQTTSVYPIEEAFEKDNAGGTADCLSLLIHRFPIPDLSRIGASALIDFLKDEHTIKLRHRLFNWTNTVDRQRLSSREIQELVATQLYDYKTWIENAHLKHHLSTFESVLTISAEVLESLVRLKPSKAVEAFFSFQKRHVDLKLDELNAPGRELAFLHHVENKIGELSS